MFAVSRRALLARINRKLKKQMQAMRKSKETTWSRSNFGEYYAFDSRRNRVVESHCQLEDFGRRIGVLSAIETVAAE